MAINFKNLTDEDIDVLTAESEALMAEIGTAMKTILSNDMSPERTHTRMQAMVFSINGTRTNGAAAAAFAGFTAALTGMSEDQIVGLVREAFQITHKSPSTAEIVAAYTEKNTEAHAAQAAKAAALGMDSPGAQLMIVGGSNKVH
jgi:hypothetical protein